MRKTIDVALALWLSHPALTDGSEVVSTYWGGLRQQSTGKKREGALPGIGRTVAKLRSRTHSRRRPINPQARAGRLDRSLSIGSSHKTILGSHCLGALRSAVPSEPARLR